MRRSESGREHLNRVKAHLQSTVFGQDDAVKQALKSLTVHFADQCPPNLPIKTFLCIGPTGVGKTELPKQLARALGIPYTTIDMTEFSERHSASRLFGAPPGYVGFEDRGILETELAKSPEGVIALNEFEKAHRTVQQSFLEIFDTARSKTGRGKPLSFEQTIFFLTSNQTTTAIVKKGMGFLPQSKRDTRADLLEGFAPGVS